MLQLNDLQKNFGRIDFREKRPGIFKVLVPFFHEDGDMYDIFVEECPGNSEKIRISDYGLTLMKLSYAFDIDTENKQQVLESIVQQNRCDLDNGAIFLVIEPHQFEAGLSQMIQVISKVSNMDIISREVIRSYFYEMLDTFVTTVFKDFHVQKDFAPLPDLDLKVDYLLPNPNKKPIFLFGVNDNTKASRVVISCLQFNNRYIWPLPIRSWCSVSIPRPSKKASQSGWRMPSPQKKKSLLKSCDISKPFIKTGKTGKSPATITAT